MCHLFKLPLDVLLRTAWKTIIEDQCELLINLMSLPIQHFRA